MSTFDYPSVSVEDKTNEQNIMSLKAYLSSLADQLNYVTTNYESRIEYLESQLKEKGE